MEQESIDMAIEKTKKRKRWCFILCAFLIFVVSVFGILQLGCVYTEKSWTHWRPDYDAVDIVPLLNKETLTEEEYETLYRQTGLAKLAIDDMRVSKEGKQRILDIQTALFTDYEIKTDCFTLFTYMEEIDGHTTLCTLKDGDIIVTSTTRVSWWRYGHAAIVVDGANARIAESLEPGTVSAMDSATTFTNLANFLVLRPKLEQSVKTEIAQYVQENMLNVPYRLTTGILTKKYDENFPNSQCAHFVWHAYKRFGVDLDSNGGAIVKPQDIALSDYVEVVQAYGFDLDKLWS